MNDTISFNAYLLTTVQTFFKNKTESGKAFLTRHKNSIYIILSTSVGIVASSILFTCAALCQMRRSEIMNDSSYNGDNLNHSIWIKSDNDGPCRYELENGWDICYAHPIINRTLSNMVGMEGFNSFWLMLSGLLSLIFSNIPLCCCSCSTDDNPNNRHRIYNQDQSHSYGAINSTACNQESPDNQLPPSYESVAECAA